MHEIGLVTGIMESVLAVARDARAERVLVVNLRIGDMREVVPEALDFAWEVFREDDPLTAEAALSVEEVHPRSRCTVCGTTFDHDRFHLRCPACGSADTELVRGREFEIISIEADISDESAAPAPTSAIAPVGA